MHGQQWFIFLGQQEHALLGSALHFIQLTCFTYVCANIEVQFHVMRNIAVFEITI